MILDFKYLIAKYNCRIQGVLHIGAHYGQEYETYKDLSLYPVVLVEALPSTFSVLKDNLKNEDVLLLNYALGNKEDKVLFYVDLANMGGSSSALEPKLHLEQYPHITFPKREEVIMRRLDELSIPSCNFINMDVQGFELEVLKGGAKYLENVQYIMTEVNRAEVYTGCAQVEELDYFLHSYGFKRVETDWAGGTWGDAFYLKQN